MSVESDGTSSGHQIKPVIDSTFDQTFYLTFPIVQFISCVSNDQMGRAQCGAESEVLFDNES
jgi:hypothetical protein